MNTTSSNHSNSADFADFGIEGDAEKPFPIHCLPPYAQNYSQEICRVDGVDPALPGACMLATLSIALGSGAELNNGTHHVRGNLFVLGSAPSGLGKSVVCKRVTQPLLDYEKSVVERWQKNILPKTKAEIRVLKQRQEILIKQASKHPQVPDPVVHELVQIEQRLAQLDRDLQEPRMVFGEATREKIADMASRSPSETLASVTPEARGCIKVLSGRYNHNTDEDVYVALWSGDPYKISRISRPDTLLHKPCLSLLWLVQPDLLDQLLTTDAMIDSGLLARTLLFEVNSAHPGPTTGPPMNQAIASIWGTFVNCIAVSVYHQYPPKVYDCQPDVVELMTLFHSCLRERMKPEGDLADVYSFAARWVEQTWRIMLVIHVAKMQGQLPRVSIETAQEAIQIMDWFATQQLLLLTSRREKKRDERFEALVEVLRCKPKQCCTLRDLRRRHRFQEAEVRGIVQRHPDILEIKDLKSKGPGRPSPSVAMTQVEDGITT